MLLGGAGRLVALQLLAIGTLAIKERPAIKIAEVGIRIAFDKIVRIIPELVGGVASRRLPSLARLQGARR